MENVDFDFPPKSLNTLVSVAFYDFFIFLVKYEVCSIQGLIGYDCE